MSDSLPISGARVLFRMALSGAILSTAACHKQPVKVFVMPPPVTRPIPPAVKLPPGLEPPELAPDTSVTFDVADLSPAAVEFYPPAPPAPAPRTRPPVVAGPKPAAVQAAPETPAPKIAQIFPAEQQRAYNSELDDILVRDQKALETLARRNLTNDQRDRMAQIRELLTQARQAREQDLVTAVKLAQRADTLAKDLLDRRP